MNKKQKELFFGFCILYMKILKKEKLNFFDKKLLNILEEYEEYANYRKEWEKREI